MTSLQTEESAGFDRQTIDYIQRAAASGLYEIRGLGAKRRVPNFDDLLFLAASLSRYPLEGYRERCSTKTVLGTRYASRPIEQTHRAAMPCQIVGRGGARGTTAHHHHVEGLDGVVHAVTADEVGEEILEPGRARTAKPAAARNKTASTQKTMANAAVGEPSSQRNESTRAVPRTPPKAKAMACAAPHSPMRTPALPESP